LLHSFLEIILKNTEVNEVFFLIIEGKVKFLCLTKHHAMKTFWGSGSIAPRILFSDLGTRSFTPRPLYPQGKSSWYPVDRRLGGPQSRSGRGGEEKKFPAPRTPIVQAVA
jgi:hypothetical protein